jgi:long-chain acyl-CoA synthetase
LKQSGRGWFHSGKIEVRVGEPIKLSATDSESAIAGRLHAEVERLLRN